MSNCCLSFKDSICPIPTSKPGFCPACGWKGKSVGVLTVKKLALDHARVVASDVHSLCRTPDCAAERLANNATFCKPDLKMRVGMRESTDPPPLCYCSNHTRADSRRQIEEIGGYYQLLVSDNNSWRAEAHLRRINL